MIEVSERDCATLVQKTSSAEEEEEERRDIQNLRGLLSACFSRLSSRTLCESGVRVRNGRGTARKGSREEEEEVLFTIKR